MSFLFYFSEESIYDTKMVTCILQGAGKLIEQIIIENEKLIYNVALRIFKNPEDAKDISQEVCIKIYQNAGKLKPDDNLKAWIFRVTYNTCIDEIRKRKNKQTYSINENVDFEHDYMTPEKIVIQKEKNSDIIDALYSLSDDHRVLIVLRDINGLTYDEIADASGISIGTVKSRIHRARLKLRDIIEKRKEQL